MRPVKDVIEGFLALPETAVDTLLAGRRAMVLAPHPDDESLGCGGFIAASCAAGLAPEVVILTDGAASHPGSMMYPRARLAELREIEARDAVKRLGLPQRKLHFLRYPDTELPRSGPSFEAAVALVLGLARETGCRLLIGPWGADPHCDHKAGAKIGAAVARQGGFNLMSYPVWGWLLPGHDLVEEPRQGGWRLDIAPHRRAKQHAIEAHASQHGRVVKDSVQGFSLPDNLLAIAARPFEVFIA